MKRNILLIICLISILAVTGCGTPKGTAERDGVDSAENTQIITNIDENNNDVTEKTASTEIGECSGTDTSSDMTRLLP